MRSRERRTCAALNASPSARRISRRITRSCVREFPSMSMRSTKTRGAGFTSKVSCMRLAAASRTMRGCTSTNGKPRRFAASEMACAERSTASPLYQSPRDSSTKRRNSSVLSPGKAEVMRTSPIAQRGPSSTGKVRKKPDRSGASSATGWPTRASA